MSIPQPSISANFVRTPNFLDPRITFIRASNATFVDKNRLIATATVDTPRFEYSSSNGMLLGLLSEEQRTNYILQSENFSTTWSATDITVSNNFTVAPDGNFTADLLTEGTANTALMTQSATVPTANLGAGSIFLKAGPNTSVTWIKVFVAGSGANGAAAWFNLSTGALGSNSVIGGGSQPIAVIDSFNDGWYRCKVSANCPGETALSLSFHSASADGSNTRVYNATYFAWGGQLENARLATSYIPTITGTATRAAEKMAIEGNNFANVFNTRTGAGTLLLNITLPPEFALDDTTRDLVAVSLSNNFTRSIYLAQSNATSYWTVGGSGVYVTSIAAGTNIIGLTYSTVNNYVRSFRNGIATSGAQNYTKNITANTAGVNAAADVILLTSANSNFFVGDKVYYRVPTGNTAIGGLTGNSYYYVSFSNTTAFALSATPGGANIDLTEARITNPGETHNMILNVAIPYDRIYLGSLWQFSSSYGLNGHFRKFAYYPSQLSNTQMQAITSI